MEPLGAVGFGETWQKQPDGTFKKIQIVRVQCALCDEIGWTEFSSIIHKPTCPSWKVKR